MFRMRALVLVIPFLARRGHASTCNIHLARATILQSVRLTELVVRHGCSCSKAVPLMRSKDPLFRAAWTPDDSEALAQQSLKRKEQAIKPHKKPRRHKGLVPATAVAAQALSVQGQVKS